MKLKISLPATQAQYISLVSMRIFSVAENNLPLDESTIIHISNVKQLAIKFISKEQTDPNKTFSANIEAHQYHSMKKLLREISKERQLQFDTYTQIVLQEFFEQCSKQITA